MKTLTFMIAILTTISLFSSVMTEDLELNWGTKSSKLKTYIQKELMKKYGNYYEATPERQDTIVKKVRKDVSDIIKNKVLFKKKSNTYDNSIYAGEFNYGNNESMLTLIDTKKTMRFFMIKDYLWKIIIIFENEKLGKKYDLASFIKHFSQKYKLKPYKIEYNEFNLEEKKPVKAYFKDGDTLLSLSYNDIYSSFILVYSSINVMKELKKRGFKVIVKSDVDLKVDMGDEVKEYDQLLYESDYTSDADNDDMKDIFSEINTDFKKEEEDSKVKKKKRDENYKKKTIKK